MLHSEEGVPFIGVVLDFEEAADESRPGETEVLTRVCWMYRVRDLKGAAKAALEEEPAVTRRAVLSEARAGGDKGTFQEVFLSNHANAVSAASIMHPIQVWCLPDERLEPLLLPAGAAGSGPPPGSAPAAGPAVSRAVLLPGFVSRRMYTVIKHKLLLLGKVPPAVAKKEFEPWVGQMVSELLRRTQAQLPAEMAAWVRRCEQRQARH
ncbi:hypothetical protein HXX76_005803 [Chlamydomonas incerta]|uniref:BAH domain-containing protein n=1 Tax=Chlamydomonas incerta TaxID=51695 RepID=A0A835TD72_CHLIN|nr:hypothetical protein HXX76_005803 [Chlamydomonas incerta]|eukprot:KAG2438199.1 hypothetical protein HXX76_005803 [Chlamydomonas incerta]